MEASLTRHLPNENPCVLIVDGSRVVRRLIAQVLRAELPDVTVIACATGAEAKDILETRVIDFVTTALRLPDMDGLELVLYIREHSPQAYIPIVAVSGDVQERLIARALSHDVTDYFDKSMGFAALADFIRGYVRPEQQIDGNVLYVEDSRVVALATRRMLEKYGLSVHHVLMVEDAILLLEAFKKQGKIPGVDIVLTDVNLKGNLTGGDLLGSIRQHFRYSKGQLPVVVMTGDDNPKNQAMLLRAGANDLVQKPVEERILLTKILFQLRVARHLDINTDRHVAA